MKWREKRGKSAEESADSVKPANAEDEVVTVKVEVAKVNVEQSSWSV